MLISEKLDWIRLKKKMPELHSISPLQLNMDSIYSLSVDLQVEDSEKEAERFELVPQKKKLYDI